MPVKKWFATKIDSSILLFYSFRFFFVFMRATIMFLLVSHSPSLVRGELIIIIPFVRIRRTTWTWSARMVSLLLINAANLRLPFVHMFIVYSVLCPFNSVSLFYLEDDCFGFHLFIYLCDHNCGISTISLFLNHITQLINELYSVNGLTVI